MKTIKYGTTQEKPWSTEHTVTNGEGREYRKPARETREIATHETQQGNLREDEIGQFHTSRKRLQDNCGAVQHMEKSLENGLTVAIKVVLGQTIRTVWQVHEPTEREEDACQTKVGKVVAVIKQLQEEAACT